MTAISVSERLLEMAAFYTPLALTVTPQQRFQLAPAFTAKQGQAAVCGIHLIVLLHKSRKPRSLCAYLCVHKRCIQPPTVTEEGESPCCGAEWSQHMVIQEDILVGAVLHKKSVWDHSYLHKAKTFI